MDDARSVASLLANSPLLHGLPEQTLERIASGARRRSYRRGEVIFHQGDPGDTLVLLETGAAKVVRYSDLGDETLLAILMPGAPFGELALIDGSARSVAVQALEPVEALTIHRE